MASLKDLRNRINSVKSTQKITSAMKLIAATKLRRAQSSAEEGRPYAHKIEQMLGRIIKVADPTAAPTLMLGHRDRDGRPIENTHLLILVTADRGLCGGFNANIVREAKRRISALLQEGKTVKVLCIGRKGRDGLRREYGKLIIDTVENAMRTGAKFGPARDLARRLQLMFEPVDKDKQPEFDVCTLIYNTFKSAMSQVVTVKRIIPYPIEALPAEEAGGEAALDAKHEFEPSDEQLLAELLPANLSTQLFGALLESYASEQGARMTAMDNATRNARDMIGRLTLTYNRTRQATITKELIEIISGAEAL